MKAKGRFISFLLVVDTFFVAYAYGFHSRQVLVVDPKLPPLAVKLEKTAAAEKGTEKPKELPTKERKPGKVAVHKPQAKPALKPDLKKVQAKSAAVKVSKKPLKKTTKTTNAAN